MSKRLVNDIYEDEDESISKRLKVSKNIKQHTLDSDEEDDSADEERYNVMNENDIEGEEDGISGIDGEIKVTPFNMKEELEEGHFDTEGHFQWNKNKDIKDNWLDNLDWVKIKSNKKENDDDNKSTDSDSSLKKKFDQFKNYKRILELLQPGETIKKALQRLGKRTKISSAERWRRNKAGITDPNTELVIELTELSNEILTQLGNMNIYEETYEFIARKVGIRNVTEELNATTKSNVTSTKTTVDDELDMYADDFDAKEKEKVNLNIDEGGSGSKQQQSTSVEDDKLIQEISWDFKWKQDDETIHGPYSTEQMQYWVNDGYFKNGVFVRKSGDAESQFYSSNRVDFDLYL